MTKEFNIGDMVYVASFGTHTEWVKCPHCLGTKTMKAILATGEEHIIDCGLCAAGYNPPSGMVSYYEPTAKVEYCEIVGLEKSATEIEYRINGIYIFREKDVFATIEEAEAQAKILADDYREGQLKRVDGKHKDTRSWAWNVSYHKSQIKRAEKDIEYNTEKLNAAKKHIKTGAA